MAGPRAEHESARKRRTQRREMASSSSLLPPPESCWVNGECRDHRFDSRTQAVSPVDFLAVLQVGLEWLGQTESRRLAPACCPGPEARAPVSPTQRQANPLPMDPAATQDCGGRGPRGPFRSSQRPLAWSRSSLTRRPRRSGTQCGLRLGPTVPCHYRLV